MSSSNHAKPRLTVSFLFLANVAAVIPQNKDDLKVTDKQKPRTSFRLISWTRKVPRCWGHSAGLSQALTGDWSRCRVACSGLTLSSSKEAICTDLAIQQLPRTITLKAKDTKLQNLKEQIKRKRIKEKFSLKGRKI